MVAVAISSSIAREATQLMLHFLELGMKLNLGNFALHPLLKLLGLLQLIVYRLQPWHRSSCGSVT
jgi:hypothetical protein